MSNQNPIVQQIHTLFRQMQELDANKGSIKQAHALIAQIAKLVAEVAKSAPEKSDHADALNWLEYATLALSGLTRRKVVKARLHAQAMDIGAQSLAIRLRGKRDRGVAFNAYNLGIDQTEDEPARALGYLLIARTILKHVPKEQVPWEFRLNLNHGIATCENNLGNHQKAARILRATLGKRRPNLGNWGELRGFASCQNLLAQIILDDLQRKRTETARTTPKSLGGC